MAEESIPKLYADLTWVLTLLWIAKAGRPGEPRPQVHYYLGDRYWRLAEQYRRKGSTEKAQRLQVKAEYHLKASGWDRPPPAAAAMAMPIPRRPTFTEAIGWRSREAPPDDAA
jgi:hypothetical protein